MLKNSLRSRVLGLVSTMSIVAVSGTVTAVAARADTGSAHPIALITNKRTGDHTGTLNDLGENASNPTFTVTVSGLTCPVGTGGLDEYIVSPALTSASDFHAADISRVLGDPYLNSSGSSTRVNSSTGAVAPSFDGFGVGAWNSGTGDDYLFGGYLANLWKVDDPTLSTPIKPGDYSYVVGCVQYPGANNTPTAWAWSTLHFNDDGSWSDSADSAKGTSTTTLQATNVTDTTATLTATVTSGATGTVQFTQGGANLGSPVTLSGGTATYSVSGLTPSTAYTFGATYSGDGSYGSSSGTAQVSTTATPANHGQQTATVTTTVPTTTPAPVTGIKISTTLAGILLTGASTRTEGQTWSASGSTGTVTVSDGRRDAASTWTLNGKVSALVNGVNSIDPKYLGWAAPTVSGTHATPGAAVASDGTGTGLTTDQPLATGTGTADPVVSTDVATTLNLTVPAGAASGAYTGTFTITLI